MASDIACLEIKDGSVFFPLFLTHALRYKFSLRLGKACVGISNNFLSEVIVLMNLIFCQDGNCV